MDYLEELNESQREAVMQGGGPVLVLAGAGSGKTRVLAWRALFLMRELDVSPERILALTFTNKAAREMRERLGFLLGEKGKRIWAGTFHSFCLYLLRRFSGEAGLKKGFVVYDREDQIAVLKRLAAEELSQDEVKVAEALAAISSAKTHRVSVEEFERLAFSARQKTISRLYEAYQAALAQSSAADFDDLLLKAEALLGGDGEARRFCLERFEHILVDEYQDTNEIQADILKHLSGAKGNVFVVGDDDQSIYEWRGARVKNILEFERAFPGVKVVRLEQNYRSTKTILEAANAVVRNNNARRGKSLWTANEDGETIKMLVAEDESGEARLIAREIQNVRSRSSVPLSECAVLYRTNAQSRLLEVEFSRLGIPYEVVGGVGFYERREIKDLLAYLRLSLNPYDRVSFRRVVNVPKRGIGPVLLSRIEETAARNETDFVSACSRLADEGDLSASQREGLQEFVGVISDIRSFEGPLEGVLERLLDESGYREMLESESHGPSADRLENVEELLNALKSHREAGGDLGGFLNDVALLTDIDYWRQEEDRVSLMTVHSAKGLEFDTVIVSGLEERLFPHSNALGEDDRLEEERRLFYVALTRAKKRLILSQALRRRGRSRDGRTTGSRFLEEIPSELIQLEGSPSGGRSAPAEGIREGDRVRHSQYGCGTVMAVEGRGEDAKYSILFDHFGLKKVVGRFARLGVC